MPLVAALAGRAREEEVLLRGQRGLRREDDRLVRPDLRERRRTLLLTEDQRRATLRVAARDERGIAGEPEMFGHGEHVVGEAVPGVIDVGGVAVAMPAEVERPHAAPACDELIRDRRPD